MKRLDFDRKAGLALAAAVAGVLALRVGGAARRLDTPELRQWALPADFPWLAELGRSCAVVAAVLALAWLVLGRGSPGRAARCLWPLAVPLLLGLAVLRGVLPLPPALGALGSATGLLTLAAGFGVLWCLLLERLPAAPAMPRRWERWAALGTAAALLLALASQIPTRFWLRQPALTGDEPEYLLTAISLLDDGDILLRNNSDGDAAAEFGAAGYRFPLPRPIHNVGVPLLVAPAYALGRLAWPAAPQKAVWYQMALITALLAFELYSLGARRGRLGALGAASIVLMPPILTMATQIYPEVPAAWLAVHAYRKLTGQGGVGRPPETPKPTRCATRSTEPQTPEEKIKTGSRGRVPWQGPGTASLVGSGAKPRTGAAPSAPAHSLRISWAKGQGGVGRPPETPGSGGLTRGVPWTAALALAALPWLHVKYGALATGVLLAGAVHSGPRRVLGSLAAFAAGVAALSVYSAVHYESWLPTASYGRTTTVLSAGIVQGTLGLLTDRSFGLLARVPALLALLPGAAILARRRPREALGLGLVTASLFAVVASYHLWWAGWSPPGRFLVPIVPFLMLLVLEAARPPYSTLACFTGLCWSASLGLGLLLVPPPPTWLGGSRALIYQDPVDPPGLAVLLSRGWDLAGALPQMIQDTPRDWALGTALVAAAGLLGLALLRTALRPVRGPAAVSLTIVATLTGAAAALDALASLADTLSPGVQQNHARNQQVREYLPVTAQPGRYLALPGPIPPVERLVQRYEAEALRGNHVFFEDRADPDASGGRLRCALAFPAEKAPIPLAFRYPVEFVPWPAGTYTARFRLRIPPEAAGPGPLATLGVRSSFSTCTGRAGALLARQEPSAGELPGAQAGGGPVEVELRFQLRCLTPKLEWLADAHGQPFCLDSVEVTAERVHPE